MAKKIKLRDKSANQLIPITRSTAVEMNDGMTLQTAYEGINSTHYTKAEINAAGYLQSFTETDPTVPSHVKSITQQDITNWNNKLDSFTETDPSISSYLRAITQQDINSWNNKLDSFTETDPIYSASAAAGITSSDISNWNSKTDNVGTITGITMNGASKGTSGVVDLGTVLTSHQSLSSYATSANYDSSAKKIYLKHDTTVLSEIDATDFIKDGMVDTAYVQGSNLIISFNTEAGKQPIEVPIANIFNASNYYTKSEIDNAAYLQSETDPVYSASAAAGITSTDITNWNSKTNNVGTITGITMNGSSKGTSGVVNLGTVITSETQLSKGTTSGNGNAVTDISVNNHQITLTKGSTFLTEHQSLTSYVSKTELSGMGYLTSVKTINNQSIVGTGNVTISGMPTVTSSDNGKVLQVVNGAWTLVSPVTLYSGSGTPNNAQGNNGDLYLQI